MLPLRVSSPDELDKACGPLPRGRHKVSARRGIGEIADAQSGNEPGRTLAGCLESPKPSTIPAADIGEAPADDRPDHKDCWLRAHFLRLTARTRFPLELNPRPGSPPSGQPDLIFPRTHSSAPSASAVMSATPSATSAASVTWATSAPAPARTRCDSAASGRGASATL